MTELRVPAKRSGQRPAGVADGSGEATRKRTAMTAGSHLCSWGSQSGAARDKGVGANGWALFGWRPVYGCPLRLPLRLKGAGLPSCPVGLRSRLRCRVSLGALYRDVDGKETVLARRKPKPM